MSDDPLLEIEKGFWTSGEQYFLDHVDAECLLVFPQAGQMIGVHDRERIAATATMPNRWRDLHVRDVHVLRPSADMALLNYRADVTRYDGQPYHALVSSAYVRRDGSWKLAFHQHSPMGEAAEAASSG